MLSNSPTTPQIRLISTSTCVHQSIAPQIYRYSTPRVPYSAPPATHAVSVVCIARLFGRLPRGRRARSQPLVVIVSSSQTAAPSRTASVAYSSLEFTCFFHSHCTELPTPAPSFTGSRLSVTTLTPTRVCGLRSLSTTIKAIAMPLSFILTQLFAVPIFWPFSGPHSSTRTLTIPRPSMPSVHST